MRRFLPVLIVLSGGGIGPATAAESYDSCTAVITSLPAVITSQGTWCLKSNLATSMGSGRAIDIQANNVTIDCNDFRIDGTGGGTSTVALGIYAADRSNLSVRRCRVSGFLRGLEFIGSGGGHLIEENLFRYNLEVGIHAVGDGLIVRRNVVNANGGSGLYPNAVGIATTGSAELLGNDVSFVQAGGNGHAVGIAMDGNPDGSARGNRISSLFPAGTGQGHWLRNTGNGRVALRGNLLIDNGSHTGLHCTHANTRARDNILVDFAIPISGCSGANNEIAN
jgi:Right handed beta helix region